MPPPTAVEAYLAGLPAERRAQLQELRETICAVAPEAEECIAYNMPAFRQRGRFLVSYEAFTAHTSLFPANQAIQDALGPDVAPYLHGKGTLRFAAGQRMPLNLVTRLVQVRLGQLAAEAAATAGTPRGRRSRGGTTRA